jgi:C-terminal processing protease CtpA/Prc
MALFDAIMAARDFCTPCRWDDHCQVRNLAGVGIGAKFTTSSYKSSENTPNAVCPYQVYSVYKGSTAESSGLSPGDIIIEVISFSIQIVV